MRFKIIFLLFVLISIVYPEKVIAGPVTYRHLISIFLLGCCIYEGFRSDKYLYLYYVFVFFYGVSSIATGYSADFIRSFFGTYISIITAYAATYLLIRKYSGTNLLVWTFVIIGVVNSIVTIGQFFEWSIIDDFCSYLSIDIDEKYLDKVDYNDSEGLAIPGLFGNVDNGYFLSAAAILTLYNKKSTFYLNLILWLVVIAASFLAQERAGFMLAITFSAFIVGDHYFSKNKTTGFFALVIGLIIIAYLIYSYMDEILSSELRYTQGFEGGGREGYMSATWNYILNNPMGGFLEYKASFYKQYPHNYFLNAFLYGGFFGGISVIVLLFLQIKRIVPYLFGKHESEFSQWAFIWGLVYIDYTLNSMVHNASIILGVMLFFIWWGAFLAYAELNEEENAADLINPCIGDE